MHRVIALLEHVTFTHEETFSSYNDALELAHKIRNRYKCGTMVECKMMDKWTPLIVLHASGHESVQ